MHACTRYLIAAILSCCDIARLSTRRSCTSSEESSDMQCLLWILKREQLRQIYSVCCGSWREKNFDKSAVFDVDLKGEELRQICSVRCGSWSEKNFDKSAVFVVDLEERSTSTNLRSVFCVWKKKREPQLHCIDHAHVVREVVYTHRYGS